MSACDYPPVPGEGEVQELVRPRFAPNLVTHGDVGDVLGSLEPWAREILGGLMANGRRFCAWRGKMIEVGDDRELGISRVVLTAEREDLREAECLPIYEEALVIVISTAPPSPK